MIDRTMAWRSASGTKARGARRGGIALATLAVIAAALLGFGAYIGYFGGPLYTLVAPTRATAAADRGTVAILLSGDMGFRIGMGPQVADRVAAQGIPVLGVNTLTYFRSERTPAEAAALVDAATARALAMPGTTRVILIGQSFGADILQFALPHLPDRLRARVALVALVVPGTSTALRARPAGLFGYGEGIANAPTARRLDWVPAVCIQGAEEDDSLCPAMTGANVTRVALPGGHLLHRDPDAVAGAIITAIRRVSPRT